MLRETPLFLFLPLTLMAILIGIWQSQIPTVTTSPFFLTVAVAHLPRQSAMLRETAHILFLPLTWMAILIGIWQWQIKSATTSPFFLTVAVAHLPRQ